MFNKIANTVKRHLVADNRQLYPALLNLFKKRDDIWIASQQTYFEWWKYRLSAALDIIIDSGSIILKTNLPNGVIVKHTTCDNTLIKDPIASGFGGLKNGAVFFVNNLKGKLSDICCEALDMEGIRNYILYKDLNLDNCTYIEINDDFNEDLIKIKESLENDGVGLEENLLKFRVKLIEACDKINIPLFRLHTHPSINGNPKQACFSPRFDVERAIWALPIISEINKHYGIQSTFYLRAMSGVYGPKDISKYCSDIEVGLHGEFLTNYAKYGGLANAAKAEIEVLSNALQRDIIMFNMHGGDGRKNDCMEQAFAAESVGLECDGTYWHDVTIPFRPIIESEFSPVWRMNYRDAPKIMDIAIAERSSKKRYVSDFIFSILDDIDEVVSRGGIAIPMLHSEYFGLSGYLSSPFRAAKLAVVTAKYVKSTLTGN